MAKCERTAGVRFAGLANEAVPSILYFASPALECVTALVYLIYVLVFEHFGKMEQKKRSFKK